MNTTIRIALDLDGVLTEHPHPLALAANAHYGLDLPDHTFVDSAGLNVPLEIREWVYSPNGPARDLLPANGAQQFVATLIDLFGVENVLIVTARPGPSSSMTLGWLQRHDFPSCDVRFADNKVQVAHDLGITHAVEDSLRHATSYAANGITCFLIAEEAAPDGESAAIRRDPSLAAVQEELRTLQSSSNAERNGGAS